MKAINSSFVAKAVILYLETIVDLLQTVDTRYDL